MRLTRILPIGVVLMLLSSCSGVGLIFGSGFSSDPNSPLTKQVIKVNDVNSLVTMSGLHVDYLSGNANNVTVEAPADLTDKIEVTVKDGRLSIGLKESVKSGLDRVKIVVVTPEIVTFLASSGSNLKIADGYAPKGGEISLSSSSGAYIDGKNIKASAMGMSVSSGADIEVSVIADAVVGNASSGAFLEVSGTARTVDLSASSGGTVRAISLKAETGSANASSGGSVNCNIANASQIKESSGGGVRNKPGE